MPTRPHEDDIVTDKPFEHETWNTCLDCGKSWKEPVTIPGLLHRSVVCGRCEHDKKRHRQGQ